MDNNNYNYFFEANSSGNNRTFDLAGNDAVNNNFFSENGKFQTTDEKKLYDLSDELVLLLQNEDSLPDEFIEDFEKMCRINCDLFEDTDGCINYFSKNFTIKELNKFLLSIKCYILSKKEIFQDSTYTDIIEWLGVDYAIDLLSNEKWKEPFTDFFASLENNDQFTAEKIPQKTCGWLCSQVQNQLTTKNLFNLLQEDFNLNFNNSDFKKYSEYFDKKKPAEKMIWILFIKTAKLLSFHLECAMIPQAGQWPEKIKDEAFPLIQLIDQQIIKERRQNFASVEPWRYETKTSPKRSIREKILQEQDQFFQNFPHPSFSLNTSSNPSCEIPEGMIEWMPNSGTSCFVSAGALWPLRFIFEKEINLILNEKKSKLWETRKVCLEAFERIYSNLAPGSTDKTTPQEINLFRSKIQTLFDYRFVQPNALAQEDAHDFLRCLMLDLLQLPSCSDPKAPQFVQRHQYELLDEQKVNSYFFDLEEAKLTGTNSANPLIQINLSSETVDSLMLSDLIVKIRETDVIERTIPLKQGFNSKAFAPCSIQAKHREQYFVASEDLAPEYFIGCLSRFYFINENVQLKRFDCIIPDATIEFSVVDNETEKVFYDLAAITTHAGRTLEAGHYYVYIRKECEGKWIFWKYDDIYGVKACTDEEVLLDAARNGYTFFYTKRGKEAIVPSPLPSIDYLLPHNQEKKSASESIIPFLMENEEGVSEEIEDLFIENSEILKSPQTDLRTNRKREFGIDNYFFSDEVKAKLQTKKRKKETKTKLEFESTLREDNFVKSVIQKKNKKQKNIQARQNALDQVFKWTHEKFSETFVATKKVFSSLHEYLQTKEVGDLFSSEEQLKEQMIADLLATTIYIIDPINDRDLSTDSGFLIPGDNFRFGESYNINPILYFYLTSEGYLVELQNLQQI